NMSIFFFQAEDGIRDLTMTGVQTCALPIYAPGLGRAGRTCPPRLPRRFRPLPDVGRRATPHPPRPPPCELQERREEQRSDTEQRSEERRVGKECRLWVETANRKAYRKKTRL